MEAVLLFYFVINIFIWIALAICGLDAWECFSFKYTFIYPWISASLEDNDINLVGKIIVCILFTIVALPAYLLWLLTLGILVLCYGVVKLFCKIFKKKK